MNSPSDVAFKSRDSGDKELTFRAHVLSPSFTALASVSSADKISVNSGGNGPVTGEEVEFDVTFGNHPLDLPAGHYFFVPQVGLSDKAPAGAHFLWLSAPKPIVPPGTPFPRATRTCKVGCGTTRRWPRTGSASAPTSSAARPSTPASKCPATRSRSGLLNRSGLDRQAAHWRAAIA